MGKIEVTVGKIEASVGKIEASVGKLEASVGKLETPEVRDELDADVRSTDLASQDATHAEHPVSRVSDTIPLI